MKLTKFVSDFFSDIGNFFKGRAVLGVDIGTTSIKIAELNQKEERLNLVNYGILEAKEYLNYPNRIIQSSSLKISEENATEILKTLLKETGVKSKIAIGSIPSFAAFTTILEMPVLSPDETQKAVLFQAPQYIPLPISEVAVDWLKIGEYETNGHQRYQRIFLIGIPQETIQKYKNIFRNAGLKLIALEIDGLAIIRSFSGGDNETILFIDLGTETSNLFLASGSNLFYASQTDYGGIYLTQAIARSLGVSVTRAEELKRRRGLLTEGAESELSTLAQPFLDVIIQEVNHAKDTYERRYEKKVARAVLLGGGANLLGIHEYFGKQMNVPVTHPDIFREVSYDLKLEPIVRQLNNELPVAVGLAKRYFSQ